MQKKVSVKELNDVLSQSYPNERSTFDEVDVVFIGGVFLAYMQQQKNWVKIPRFFDLTENDNHWNHATYLEQIEDMYKVRHYQIFDNFPNPSRKEVVLYSGHAAPPIYITQKSLNSFFGESTPILFERVRKAYEEQFELSDFVDRSNRNKKYSKSKFDEYEAEIRSRLRGCSLIKVFVFVVACKRLKNCEKHSIEKISERVEAIWDFTQEYTAGLYELAKNIVEHSGTGENNGTGMITIRAYRGGDGTDSKNRVLETHLFDYGTQGVYETMRKNTEKGAENGDADFVQDAQLFREDAGFTLKDFFEPSDNTKHLRQQLRKELAHYGLLNFRSMIEHHKGVIIASSVRGQGREIYTFQSDTSHADVNKRNIARGTSYYFELPFKADLFQRSSKSFRHAERSMGETSASSLSDWKSIEMLEFASLSEVVPQQGKIYVININIGTQEIYGRNNEEDVIRKIVSNLQSQELDKFTNLRIAFNFGGVQLSQSSLLRILAWSILKTKQDHFIIYNVDWRKYIEMVEDNRKWFVYNEKHTEQAEFWPVNKSVLVYARHTRVRDGENDSFYFADILGGNSPEEFYSINTTIAKTFHNAIQIVNEGRQDSVKYAKSKRGLAATIFQRKNDLSATIRYIS